MCYRAVNSTWVVQLAIASEIAMSTRLYSTCGARIVMLMMPWAFELSETRCKYLTGDYLGRLILSENR